jgi:PPP family 3-phenylpropionic acid transporter
MTAVPWMMASGLASFAVVTWLMRDAPAARAVARARVPLGHRLREPAVMAFLVSAFLMVCAHGALYAFWSLYLERQGYSRTAIGVIWAVGVLAEIALFAWQRRLFQRFDAMRLLQMSFIVCALRFAVVGTIDAMPLWCVIATQLLHAITFGVHHSASMAVLHRWFEPSQQAQAQAAYIVVAWGMGGGVGGSLAAWLWSQISPGAAFLGAALTALLGWIAVTVAARYPVRP